MKRGSIAEVDSVELNKKFKESQEELNGNKNLRGVIQLMQAPSRWVLQRRDSKTNKIQKCECNAHLFPLNNMRRKNVSENL